MINKDIKSQCEQALSLIDVLKEDIQKHDDISIELQEVLKRYEE